MPTVDATKPELTRHCACSSAKIDASRAVPPRPPYSTGHVMPAQPPSNSARCQPRLASKRSRSVVAASRRSRVAGACSASHARASARNASSSVTGLSHHAGAAPATRWTLRSRSGHYLGVEPADRTLPRIRALDGLRGVAVIAVLLFHDQRLRGGYLGVDLFFVLSGFLITSLLLADHQRHGRVGLRNFYARRARRLLPALGLALVGVALYAAVWARPAELPRIRWDGIGTLFYFQNWREILTQQNYWDAFTAPSPLQHAWSLS